MFKEVHPYIHEYDFPVHEKLVPYKEEILGNYIQRKEKNPNLSDLHLPKSHPLTTLLEPKLNRLVKKNYWINKPSSNYGFRTYIQNNELYTSYYHNHHKLTSSITGVFYLDPPKEGGELSFLINPDPALGSPKEILIKPIKNKLYLFPYWLYHKPLPQKDENYRVCFNWAYGSHKRPVSKITSVMW